MKRKPHVLILNRCYPPEVGATGKVLIRLAHALAEPFRVTLLVGRPAPPCSERQPDALLDRRAPDSLTVERVGNTALPQRRLSGRIINYMTYLALALVRVLRVRPAPDIVIAMTDPPLACVIGAVAVKWRGCRFVYSVQDLHPDMAVSAGMVKPGWLVSWWQRVHTWAMQQAHVVIVLGEDMSRRIVAKGVDKERVIAIRHGAEPVELPRSSDHPLVRRIRDGFLLVVLYSGNLGYAGAWDSVLAAAKLLHDEQIRFVFIGDGSLRRSLESSARGLAHVSFLPFQSAEDYLYALQAGDLHLVTIRAGLEGLVVPSKLYSLLMAGRPVFAVAPQGSDIAALVRRYRCGLVADPCDPEAIAQALRYARDHLAELRTMGERAREAGTQFTDESMFRAYCRVLEELAAA